MADRPPTPEAGPPGGETDEEACREALDDAFRLLSWRARSRRELDDRLSRRGHPPAIVAAALARCEELGYVDDAAFARAWVTERLRGRPRGRRALMSELLRRGVGRRTAERAIDAGFAEAGTSERELLREVAARRARRLGRTPPEVAARRLAGWLRRRGFPPDAVREEVRRLVPEPRGPGGSVGPGGRGSAD